MSPPKAVRTSVVDRGCEACGAALRRERIGATCTLLRCERCGHVLRDLDLCPARARTHPWGGDPALDRLRLALMGRRLVRLTGGRAALDVLEIGFGTGRLLANLRARGHRVSGVERGLLERDLDPRLGQGEATLFEGRAEDVALPPSSFDLILAIHVVEHLDDPLAVLVSCHEALRPSGLLYLMTPNADSGGLRVFGEHWWNLEDPTHVRFFSKRSIGEMLGRAGFTRYRVSLPRSDGGTMEAASVLRTLGRGRGPYGVMSSKLALPACATLTPPALLARAVWPSLAPSMEVAARP